MKDKERFEAFKHQAVEENEARYGKEAREKYGDRAADRSNARILSLTEEAHSQWTALGEEILSALAAAVRSGEDPAGKERQRIAALHRQWLSFSWETYTPQAHQGLARMYTADPRFTACYDKDVPGCAAFLRDAIDAYVS